MGGRLCRWIAIACLTAAACGARRPNAGIGSAQPDDAALGEHSTRAGPWAERAPPDAVHRLDDVSLPDGARSMWACADGRARRWSLRSSGPATTSSDCSRGLAVSGNGRTVVAASDATLWVRTSETPEGGKEIRLDLEDGDHVVDLGIARNAPRAAVTTQSGNVHALDLSTGRTLPISKAAHPSAIRVPGDDSYFGVLGIARDAMTPRLALSGDGRALALTAAVREGDTEAIHGRMFVWDLDQRHRKVTEPFDVLDSYARAFVEVTASPTDHRFVTATADGALRLFDETKHLWASPAATAYPVALAFSNDGQRFAAAYADGALRIFGPLGTSEALELWPEAGPPLALAFSAGGETVLLAVERGPLSIVDARNGELLARMSVLDRGWVVVSADGAIDGDRDGLDAIVKQDAVADVLGWDRRKAPGPARVRGLLARVLAGG